MKKNQNKAARFVSRHRDLNLGRGIDVSQSYSLFLHSLIQNSIRLSSYYKSTKVLPLQRYDIEFEEKSTKVGLGARVCAIGCILIHHILLCKALISQKSNLSPF